MSDLKDILQAGGPFASVLVDVRTATETGGRERRLRIRECLDALREQGAPDAVTEALAGTLAEPEGADHGPSRYLLADAGGTILHDQPHALPTSGHATWGPLPDLFPLLAERADRAELVLVSVEHTGGSVATFDSHALAVADTAQVEGEEQYVQKVRGGGLAHRRMQQNSENVWRDNAREVAELALTKLRSGPRLVVVAGSAESRGEVVEALAPAQAEVVELDRAGLTEDDAASNEALLRDLQTIAEQHLEQERQRLGATVAQRRGQGEGVADGVDATLDCLVRGQVETLLIEPDALRDQQVDPAAHPGLPLPETGPARADLALVAAAVATEADVRPLPHDVDGPVVALLRWAQSA